MSKNKRNNIYNNIINAARKNLAFAFVKLALNVDKKVFKKRDISLDENNGTVFLKFSFSYKNTKYEVKNIYTGDIEKFKNKTNFFAIYFKHPTTKNVIQNKNVFNVFIYPKNNKTEISINGKTSLFSKINNLEDFNKNNMKSIPDTLYKYKYFSFEDFSDENSKFDITNTKDQNANTIRQIVSNNSFFPTPHQLNDLYDGTNYLSIFYYYLCQRNNKLIDHINDIYQKLYNDQNLKINDKEEVVDAFLRESTNVDGKFKKIIECEANKFKEQDQLFIFSLTTEKDNALMWAHYANNNNGLCVGFPKKELLNFIKNNNNKHRTAYINRVIYDCRRPDKLNITNSEYFFGNTIQEELNLLSLSCFKNKIWEYEEEIRIVVFNKTTDDKEQFQQSTKLVPNELIFGPKWDESQIEEFVKKFNNDLTIQRTQANVSRNDYSIKINKK